MFETLTIQGVRGIESLHLEGLSLVNVIAGDNGTGKTTILEAAVLLISGTLTEFRRAQSSRGLPIVPSTRFTRKYLNESLFSNFASSGEATIQGVRASKTCETRLFTVVSHEKGDDDEVLELGLEEGDDLYLQIEMTHDSTDVATGNAADANRARFLTTTDRRPLREDIVTLGDMRLASDRVNLRDVIAALRTLRPDIVDVEYIESSSGPGFYVTLKDGRRVPLGSLGGGANAVFRYLMALQKVSGGVLAIDEVEGGFHYSRLNSVFKALLHAARASRTQIFCTTHSREVLAAIAEVAAETPENDLSVISTYRDTAGRIAAQVYNEKDALLSLRHGYELR